MSNPKNSRRWWVGGAVVALLGLAGWWLSRSARPAVVNHETGMAVSSPSVDAPAPSSLPNQPASEKPAATPTVASVPAPAGPAVPAVSTPPSSQVTTPVTLPEKSARPIDAKSDAETAAASGVIPRPTSEAQATARMYAAHASLRTPEVADPDSKANKQILQTMVLKALAQSAMPAPAIQAKN